MFSFILALAAIAIAAAGQYYLDSRVSANNGLILYGVAAVVISIAFLKQDRVPPIAAKVLEDGIPPKFGWKIRAIGLFITVLGFVAASLGSRYLLDSVTKNGLHFSEGLLYWAIGLLLAGPGLYIVDGKDFRAIPGSVVRAFRAHRLEIMVFCIIMAVGIFARVYQLDYFPPDGVAGDESQSGSRSMGILRDPGYRPIYNAISYYPIALTFNWLGVSILNMRLSFVLVGILTLPALYLLVRELYGFRLAAIATSLLSVSRWHASWGRIALDWVYIPFFEVLAFLFLFRGIHGKGKYNYFLAGVCTALGLYAYVAFRIVPIIIAVFVLYKCITHRRFLRENVVGLGVFLASLAVFSAPFLATLTSSNQRDLTERYDSIVAPLVNRAATGGQYTALVENAKITFLRIVQDGDSWPASNLPKAAMIDSFMAILFVLGLGYCTLLWWRREHFLFVVTFFATTISGGVLTIMPVAQRFVGIIPVVIIFVAIAADGIWSRFEKVVGVRRGALFAIPVVATVLLIGATDYDTYFNKQANARETRVEFLRNAVEVSKNIGTFAKDHRVYLMADFEYYYPLHDFAWLAGYPTGQSIGSIADGAPARENVGDKNVAYSITSPYDWQASEAYLRLIYPGGRASTSTGPLDLNWFTYGSYQVERDEVLQRRGLSARYYSTARAEPSVDIRRRDEGVNFTWNSMTPPVEVPFGVEWQGTFYVQRYGEYTLGLEATGRATILIDDQPLASKEVTPQATMVAGKRILAIGWHRLRIEYAEEIRGGSVRLSWQGPGIQRGIMPATDLSTISDTWGLEGSYFRGTDWSGSPVFKRLHPFIAEFWRGRPVPEPYSVEWIGSLKVEKPGRYGFSVDQLGGGAQVLIDGNVVVDTAGSSIRPRNDGTLDLSDGSHSIKIRYFFKGGETGRIRVLWTPPGGQKQVVPAAVLKPEIAKAEVERPKTESVTAPSPEWTIAPVVSGNYTIFGQQGFSPGEFSHPRDVAIDRAGNIYVADEANRRIQKFDPSGKFVLSWDQFGPQDKFSEPLAVVVDSKDNVIVLDSNSTWLGAFTGEGKPLRQWNNPKGMFHPRGLAIDSKDNVYVADTGFNRILKFGPDDRLVAEISRQGSEPGQVSQPTDVAVDEEGNLYVVDQGNNRLQVLTPDGSHIRNWRIPTAGTGNGTHIAMAKDGTIYTTNPEAGQVVQYDRTGEVLRQWGSIGEQPGQFRLPVGITVDVAGRVYVADTMNHRIVKVVP